MKPPFRNRARPKPAANSPASAAQAKFKEGLALHQKGQLAQAQVLYQQVLTMQPNHFEALHLLGVIAAQTNNPLQAIELIGRAIAIYPNNAAFYCNRGNAQRNLKRLDEALESYDRALKLTPDNTVALSNRGNVLQELKRLDEALGSYDRALKLKPDHAEALYNRGNVLQLLKRFDEALGSYDHALRLKPDYAEVLSNRGVTLQELGRLDEALESSDRALRLKPDYAEALSNRGVTLQALDRLDEALEGYDRALKLKPDYAEALYNRGNVLLVLKRFDEALGSYDRALKLKPDYAEALSNRGVALQEIERLDEALESYDRALRVKPDYAEALYNRGNVLQELMRLDEALKSYDRALELNPDYKYLYGTWLHTKMRICDWSDAESQFAGLFGKIQRDEKATPSFPVLALTSSLALQRKTVKIWVNDKYPERRALPAIPKHARHEKVRIGYYSADYHNHATAHLMAELFERHDRAKFELVAFSFGPDKNDEMRKRVSAAFDQFIDVRNKSDKDVALLSRNLGIDVAVDLKGYTQDMRVGIFSYRAAPLQVSYLGYPGTMGAGYMDYLIADSTLIPEANRQYYSEKIAYLPNSYQVNDSKRAIADKIFTRKECGLLDAGFVFCCFNNGYKITPATFDGWMRILRRVEGSVLWLLEDNPTAVHNLRKEAEASGIEGARLVFAKRMPLAEHLARHRVADLFIDTLPYNAHTTASDALWAGLPVLTCMGEAFASRVAASLLNAIDLPELITTTREQYEDLAVELATNPEKLHYIKQKLERHRLTTPLFDTELFTKHIEAAYTAMYERYQADLPPEHFYASRRS